MSDSVLVVEDDLVLRETLAYRLVNDGYDVVVADDGYTAIEVARAERPDVILLDVMLPGLDGFEVCRLLRQEMTTPILMLTARTDEVDRVVGLEIGADDYITKPFSMRELLARIKAQIRRMRMLREVVTTELPLPASGPLRFGNLEIDLNRCEVTLAGTPIQLKPKEFELLASLAQHKGQVLSREQLMKAVWGWEYTGQSRTVDVHIRWLREKIEVDPGNPQRIVTVRGMGYRFDG
ncbi:MAG: response regulator transcription factor [Anaerolineae bacterium]|nr:response regulator transcription factor [Anaerolineae bacterium]